MAAYDAFARFYDSLTANVDYRARAKYFHSLISPYVGECAALLDLACGTGSLSVELAKLGHSVIGIDRSCEMLSLAAQKAGAHCLDIMFLVQDMTRLDLYGDIDAAVCALDSLNHLHSDAEFERTLERVALFLRPGGIFAFDVNTPYKHRTLLADRCYVYETDEVYCVWQNSTESLVTQITLDFFVKCDMGYERYTEAFSERAFDSAFVTYSIKRAGLELLAIYDEDSFAPPGELSERIVYLTRKI